MTQQQRAAKAAEAVTLLDKAEALYLELHSDDAEEDAHSAFEMVREAIQAEGQ
jgi:nicotinamide riboside kinase